MCYICVKPKVITSPMKYLLPLIIGCSLLFGSCSKDTVNDLPELPKELSPAEKESLVSDSLFSIFKVRFKNPLELNVTSGKLNEQNDNLSFFVGFRNGNPWLSIYDKDKKLLQEHTEALPDSIKSNKKLNWIYTGNELQTKDALILPSFLVNKKPNELPEGLAGCLLYYYDFESNDIKRVVYDYGDVYEVKGIYQVFDWYDGYFIAQSQLRDKHSIYSRNLETISVFNGHGSSASKGSFQFVDLFEESYPTSIFEYFTVRTYNTDVIVEKKSITSVLIKPEYPEPPYYSYLLGQFIFEAIKKPSNYVRMENEKTSIKDLGDRLEVTIIGTMLLSDDKNKTFYEKEVSGKVLINKKTGELIRA